MDITIYGLPTCGVCKMIVKKLEEKNIPFYYIDNMEEVTNLAKKLNKTSVPIIELDGEFIDIQDFNRRVLA